MWTWGGVFHAVPGMEPWGSFLGGWINHHHIIKNLPIILSFFGFYLLPILMAASMFVQTKLNPKPTDPMQARLMVMMPIIFSIFFFFFPAGLVLYWLINNLLSMAQQWHINRKIHAEALKKKGHA